MLKEGILKLSPKTKTNFFGKKIMNKNVLMFGFNDDNANDLVKNFPVFMQAENLIYFCNTGKVLNDNIINSKNGLKYFPKNPDVYTFAVSLEDYNYLKFKISNIDDRLTDKFNSNFHELNEAILTNVSNCFDDYYFEEEIMIKE